MIPRLPRADTVDSLYRSFLGELVATDFDGEVRFDYGSRLVVATDNSVYQVVPQAVVFPRSTADVVALCRLGATERYRPIRFVPRGAGTGTNGGSLGSGLCVDVSKYMNEILEIDLAAGSVRVQPGVILDQLNAYLEPHGLFFAPHVATSDRATIGGMISNDSCGVGSRIYGRTSRHVESLTVVLADGSEWTTRTLSPALLATADGVPVRIAEAARTVHDVVDTHRQKIAERFRPIDRFLTGYNLAQAVGESGAVDLNAIFAGSEGTLGFVTEAVLRVIPIPRHKTLVVATYASFDDALSDAETILEHDPSAIETIDETIVDLARRDMIWRSVAPRLQPDDVTHISALNLVELCDSDAGRLELRSSKLLRSEGGLAVTTHRIESEPEVAAFWALRKKGAGLLGNMPGARRPVAFVEDCAVPPQRLRDFVREFRAILDRHGLHYGIYGHVDVGCLHVRPALDLRRSGEADLLRAVSDEVFGLVESYGGVFWGEHGKGFRSQYNPRALGPELYEQVRRIKQVFDPFNQMNPGKVATPTDSTESLVSVATAIRGDRDREIAVGAQQAYASAIACNGNGACFSWDVDRPMCPSMKATGDRIHSPKGRAALMREWLRLLSRAADVGSDDVPSSLWGDRRSDTPSDFSHEVFDAFAGCLACKACVAECPIHVDIPSFKSEFLHLYHQRYRRSVGDRLVASAEGALPWASRGATVINRMATWRWVRRALSAVAGLEDPPRLAPRTAEDCVLSLGFERVDWDSAELPTHCDATDSVVLIPDAFTNFFEPQIFVDMCELARRLGKHVLVLPFRPSGKTLHVKGMLDEFRPLARRQAAALSAWNERGVDLVCIEPAIALLYRQEYRGTAVRSEAAPSVMLPQEWLHKSLGGAAPSEADFGDEAPYVLMSHCTESTTAAAANEMWRTVFAVQGLQLEIPSLGCCGMAGSYGHESSHLAESRRIFELSWYRRIGDSVDRTRLLATGYSCRSQAARFGGVRLRHPVQVLRWLSSP